jgi:hypothetical protein
VYTCYEILLGLYESKDVLSRMRDDKKMETHVKLRCIVCGGKFDSKYDKIPSKGTYRVGDIHRSFIHCERCRKRVDVKVIQVR